MRDRFLDDLTRELAAPVAGLTAEIEALAGIAPAHERRGPDERTASSALVRHLKRLGAVVEQLNEVARLTNRQTAIPAESVDLGRRGARRSCCATATAWPRWDRRSCCTPSRAFEGAGIAGASNNF